MYQYYYNVTLLFLLMERITNFSLENKVYIYMVVIYIYGGVVYGSSVWKSKASENVLAYRNDRERERERNNILLS
jgi:hypothetical protein